MIASAVMSARNLSWSSWKRAMEILPVFDAFLFTNPIRIMSDLAQALVI